MTGERFSKDGPKDDLTALYGRDSKEDLDRALLVAPPDQTEELTQRIGRLLIADDVAGQLTPPGQPMGIVKREGYDVDALVLKNELYSEFIAVEAALLSGTLDRAALRARVGGDRAESAIFAHKMVVDRVSSHHRAAVPVPEVERDPPRKHRSRGRLSESEARVVFDRLADGLGIPAAVLSERAPGARSDTTTEGAAIARARRAVAFRLFQLGASNAMIGRVMGGRSRDAARQLVDAARRERLKDLEAAWAHSNLEQGGGPDE